MELADHHLIMEPAQLVVTKLEQKNVVTGTAHTIVVVGVSGRIVPIRTTRTGIRRIIPVATKIDSALTQLILFCF
jgi:hypothetical protein